ncbi:HNH endonuclease [Mycobacteroides abscessus]|uniref:HNH endonuclease n=1 Tax=Mycobacteroides abscessus TaxID=36809 RepID=UPI000E68F7DB|nr:HNH endonuclease signature motif containing protein [Mycobacteroides abscessus]RIT69229.1 HNH endonuclease [Mycobacteroides abscessus]
MAWTERRTPRPSRTDEQRMRSDALQRLPHYCGARGDGKPEADGCGATGVYLYCDHIVAHWQGGATHWRNAQLLCGPCHKPKTGADSRNARAAARARRPKHRQPERHPGLL